MLDIGPSNSRRSVRQAARWVLVTASLAASLSVAALPSAGEESIELEGDWYVLIHFRDSTESESVERWDDRIWRFEKRGSRLGWTEYPMAIFDDTSARFERVGDAQAQSATFWEPNDVQRDEIRSGLSTRTGGERTKTLGGDPKRGYSSGGASLGGSTSVIGYSETWRIETEGGLPVFSQEAELGAEGRVESLSGLTRFSVTEQLDDGAILTGTYERDGTRQGTFRLYRTPRVKIARK